MTEKKMCSRAIDVMRDLMWQPHLATCDECQAFVIWLETLGEEGSREHVSKLSKELTGDSTEIIRCLEREHFNREAAERSVLEGKYGKVWDTQELQKDFIVESFLAPYVVVRRKSDDKQGSLQFQHMPRYYFNWQEA